MSKKEKMKSEMMDAIRSGGAWFSTGTGEYTKIAYSEADNCYFARECFLKDGGLEGGAYSFGTDWFDISFHGKYIDIYVDPETFRRWAIRWDAERGTCYEEADGRAGMAERVLRFCKQADREALDGIRSSFRISGTSFDKVIELSGGSDAKK